MLSAQGRPRNSRAFAGFLPETLMEQGRKGLTFPLRIAEFSPKPEGGPIFLTRFNALIGNHKIHAAQHELVKRMPRGMEPGTED